MAHQKVMDKRITWICKRSAYLSILSRVQLLFHFNYEKRSLVFDLYSRVRTAAVILALVCLLVPPAMGVEDPKTATSSPPTIPIPKTERKLSDLVDYLTDVSMRLIDFEYGIKSLKNIDTPNTFAKISKELEELPGQLGQSTFTPRFDYNQLSIIKLKLQQEQRAIEIANRSLSERLDKLADWNNSWSLEKQKLASWQGLAGKNSSFMMHTQEISVLQSKIDAVLDSITRELESTLAVSRQIRTIQLKIHSLDDEVDSRTEAVHRIEIQQITPSVLSSEFYAQLFDHGLWQKALQSSITFFILQQHAIPEHKGILVAIATVVAFFSIIIYRSRPFIKASMAWYPLTLRPVATASFICLTLLIISDFLIPDLPSSWDNIIKLFLLLAILRLSPVLIDAPMKRKRVYQLALLVLTFYLANLAKVPLSCLYLFIFTTAITGILYGFWLLWKSRWSETPLLGRWTTWLLIIFLSVLLVLMSIGRNAVSLYLFFSFLATVVLAVDLWILFLVTNCALELLFFKSPAPMLRRNASNLVTQCIPIICLLYFTIFAVHVLKIWQIYPTIQEAIQDLMGKNLVLWGWDVTPVAILKVMAIVYGTLLVSRAVQGVLRQEILPRKKVDIGAQFSILRLANYAFIFIGFLVLLVVSGVELTKLTILGSALSVGVGFGLQAIVNNFASGLILLFERPVKIGDMLQLGNEIGEIKELGLRATVVQTLDNARIVIPNAALISSQVTNWTLGERQVRVKIPVGVGYESDTNKVFDILLNCAKESPMVLSSPPATVLFLAFGESSLNFELRVWIPEFKDRRLVLSELNRDIMNEFQMAGIEIPFPQRDVHLQGISCDMVIAQKAGESKGELSRAGSKNTA